MTDKELKKLSRLEILELLLEQTKENEKLKAEFEKLKADSGAGSEADKLHKLSLQLNSALSYANIITRGLKTAPEENTAKKEPVVLNSATQSYPSKPGAKGEVKKTEIKNEDVISDRKLYWRIMYFYSKNPKLIRELPPDIQRDVIARIRGILNARKK